MSSPLLLTHCITVPPLRLDYLATVLQAMFDSTIRDSHREYATLPMQIGPAGDPNLSLFLGPPRALPTDHATDIYFGFSHPTVPPLMHGLVPLSYLGASGTFFFAL